MAMRTTYEQPPYEDEGNPPTARGRLTVQIANLEHRLHCALQGRAAWRLVATLGWFMFLLLLLLDPWRH
jgi:hypothetical protein